MNNEVPDTPEVTRPTITGLKHGTPLPDGQLVLEAGVDVAASQSAYRPDPMRLAAGALIRTADREYAAFRLPDATNEANADSVARSGQRVCTLIMYLNNVPAGAETTFPDSGRSVLPRKGHALYFEYSNAAGQTDPASLHAGAPVLAAEKWIATTWVRSRGFVPRGPQCP